MSSVSRLSFNTPSSGWRFFLASWHNTDKGLFRQPGCDTPIHVQFTLLALLLAMLLPASTIAQDTQVEPWSVKRLLEYQQSLNDSLQVQDVYKLIYQASFGPEHLMADSVVLERYLLEELASMDTVARRVEDLIERISPQGQMVRVNLRPYSRLALSPGLLVSIMTESARQTMPDTLMFYRHWNEFCSLVLYGLLDYPLSDLEKWDAQVQHGDIPAVHHSAQYRRSNSPAYRVARSSVVNDRIAVGRP